MSSVISPIRIEDETLCVTTADSEPSATETVSGRAPRSDRLLHYEIDPAHAKIVKQRITPLARYYWRRQGNISIEELCMSAYIQGILDAQQLP